MTEGQYVSRPKKERVGSIETTSMSNGEESALPSFSPFNKLIFSNCKSIRYAVPIFVTESIGRNDKIAQEEYISRQTTLEQISSPGIAWFKKSSFLRVRERGNWTTY
jgi:hypothetical protein